MLCPPPPPPSYPLPPYQTGLPRVKVEDLGDNWNALFQEAQALPEATEMERTYKHLLLATVYRDFTAAAVMYGRTIISEFFLHSYLRSIRPREVGGFAGGKKFLFRGILFKLADGAVGPWAGSDEAAAKAAGHELRGHSYYAHAGVAGLHFSPMCILDYKGFRMVCAAQLPLGAATLISGSSDGGINVVGVGDAEVARVLEEAAARLRLRPHPCRGTTVYSGADVEVHKGLDGNLYMLDLARSMPPEDPKVRTST
ncbi:CLU domain-containing protein [Tribonema minus]|uniref:CLU domain-containing protein n=1 Tax=Tribonema minus TaxID=303371 RepID=A0A835YKN4_9STRA|nr:CLU domain-containing protein [Tribonema minus]